MAAHISSLCYAAAICAPLTPSLSCSVIDMNSYMQMPGVQPMQNEQGQATTQQDTTNAAAASRQQAPMPPMPPMPQVQPFPQRPSDEQLLAQFPPGSQVLPDPAVAPNYNPRSFSTGGNYPNGFRSSQSTNQDCCTIS